MGLASELAELSTTAEHSCSRCLLHQPEHTHPTVIVYMQERGIKWESPTPVNEYTLFRCDASAEYGVHL